MGEWAGHNKGGGVGEWVGGWAGEEYVATPVKTQVSDFAPP